MTDKYDSRPDTQKHINRVNRLLYESIMKLQDRAVAHDQSKLNSPEVEVFDRVTPKLKELTYGSDEYKASLAEIKPALDHHYANNSHHPEHFENGVDGMTLLDLLEMIIDWKAAGERHGDGGDINRSIDINTVRFKLSDQLVSILRNTAKEMGW